MYFTHTHKKRNLIFVRTYWSAKGLSRTCTVEAGELKAYVLWYYV